MKNQEIVYIAIIIYERNKEYFKMEIPYNSYKDAVFYVENVLTNAEFVSFNETPIKYFQYIENGLFYLSVEDYISFISEEELKGVVICDPKCRYVYQKIIDSDICEKFITVK